MGIISLLLLAMLLGTFYSVVKGLRLRFFHSVDSELDTYQRLLGRAHLLVRQREIIDKMPASQEKYHAIQQWRQEIENYIMTMEDNANRHNVLSLNKYHKY